MARMLQVVVLILPIVLGWPAAADPSPGLSVVPGTFDYPIFVGRGERVRFRVTVLNTGEARDCYVVVLVHDQQTGKDTEVYSPPRRVGAGEQLTFGASSKDGLSHPFPRDGRYSMAAAVYHTEAGHDVRDDIQYERRLIYVGTAIPKRARPCDR